MGMKNLSDREYGELVNKNDALDHPPPARDSEAIKDKYVQDIKDGKFKVEGLEEEKRVGSHEEESE
jgi:hypothetical protein